MASAKEILEAKLDRAVKEHGPDDPLAQALRAQLTSMGTVRHPSQLAAINSERTDKFHGATLQSEAPSDPMLPAMDGMEAAMLEQAKKFGATEQPPQVPSPSEAPTTPSKSEPA